MEVRTIESKANKLVVELKGEDHTIANALREALWAEGAEGSAYRISHPLTGSPEVLIISKKVKPETLLRKAAVAVAESAIEFKKKFSDAWKK